MLSKKEYPKDAYEVAVNLSAKVLCLFLHGREVDYIRFNKKSILNFFIPKDEIEISLVFGNQDYRLFSQLMVIRALKYEKIFVSSDDILLRNKYLNNFKKYCLEELKYDYQEVQEHIDSVLIGDANYYADLFMKNIDKYKIIKDTINSYISNGIHYQFGFDEIKLAVNKLYNDKIKEKYEKNK